MLQSMGSQRVRHNWVTYNNNKDKSLFFSPETRDDKVGTVVSQSPGPQILAVALSFLFGTLWTKIATME